MLIAPLRGCVEVARLEGTAIYISAHIAGDAVELHRTLDAGAGSRDKAVADHADV